MQKCFLFFTLSFLLFLSFSSCERESSLVTQVIELNDDVVVIDEDIPAPLLLRHFFDGEEVIDTLGQAIMPVGGEFIHLSNIFYDEYECVVDGMGNYTFGASGPSTSGGNPQQYTFILSASILANGSLDEPFFSYALPFDGENSFSFTNYDPCTRQYTPLEMVFTEMTEDRVKGTIDGTVTRILGSVATCFGIQRDTAQVSIEFDLPREYCN